VDEYKWCPIELDEDKNENYPGPLYKHTAVVYQDEMYIFGGIFQYTYNTNLLRKYNFEKKIWDTVI